MKRELQNSRGSFGGECMRQLGVISIILAVVLAACAQADYADVLVTRVFDGDTVQLANGEKVRLLGIDTPETEYSYADQREKRKRSPQYYQEARRATEFLKESVEGKRVRLEFDLEKRDKYGRLLAYVYLADGTFVNAEIIKQGYAAVMVIPPNLKYAELFQRLYQEAILLR